MFFKIVSLAGIPLIIAVIIVMLCRKLYKEFPFFFSYLLIVLGSEIIRQIFLHRAWIQYFYVYWTTEALTVAVAFLVLYELFLVRIFPIFNITPVYRYLFPITGIVVLGFTALMFFKAPSTGPSRLAVLVGEFALALSFCQVATITFFMVLVLFMSREWARHDFGIALGYGLYASVKLIISSLRANHSYNQTVFDQIPTVAYVVAALIWLIFLIRSDPEPPKTEITDEMIEKMNRTRMELRSWFRKN